MHLPRRDEQTHPRKPRDGQEGSGHSGLVSAQRLRSDRDTGQRAGIDPETGERFTIKRYRSRKTEDENGWRHVEITLEPVNPDFDPIVIGADDEGEAGVVAELIEVLGPGLA